MENYVIYSEKERLWYAGKFYVHQGEDYPSLTFSKFEAKFYSTEGRAKSALRKLDNKYGQDYGFAVKIVEAMIKESLCLEEGK